MAEDGCGMPGRLAALGGVVGIVLLSLAGCGLFTPSAGVAFAGTWMGTYDGLTDSGTFTLTIPNSGKLQLTGRSNLASYVGSFSGDGTCSSSGSVRATGEIGALLTSLYRIELRGQLSEDGEGSGTFTSTTVGGVPIGSGQWTATKGG